MGEDVSDMATTTSQLQAKLLALTGGKVDIMLDENTFKNSTQILREMADAWSDMDDISRASALELMGGKRQANVLSALIQNFDTVEKVIETSANSAGSALKENERYLNSIQGKIDQFTNATQAMWNDTLNSDVVKFFVELATQLVKIVDAVGPLNIALVGLFAYLEKQHGIFDGIFKPAGDALEELKRQLAKAEQDLTKAEEADLRRSTDKTAEKRRNAEERVNILRRRVQEASEEAVLDGIDESFDPEKAKRSLSAKKGQRTKRINKLQAEGKTFDEIQVDPMVQQYTRDVEEAQRALDEYNASIQRANATTVSATNVTGAHTSATWADIWAEITKTDATSESVLAITKQVVATKLANSALVQKGLATMVASGAITAETAAEAANLPITTLLTAGFYGLASGIKAATLAMWELMTTTPLGPILLAIVGAVAAITLLVKSIDSVWVTAAEAKENLEELNSEINDLESDLDSLNDELETTQERMEELLSKDSLSFVEQEELDNLRLQNEYLEKQIEMQELILKNKKEARLSTAKDVIGKTWNSNSYEKEDYQVDWDDGVIKNDNFWSVGLSGKDAIDKGLKRYEKTQENIDLYKMSYQTALEKYGSEHWITKQNEDKLNEFEDLLTKQAGGINMVLDDMSNIISENDLQYGDDKEINKFLDEYYAYTYKWQEAQGISTKSSAIASIFSDSSSESIKGLKETLSAIASDDSLNAAEKQTKALGLVNDAINSTTGDYDRLKTSMDIVGVTADQIARYFVQLSKTPDSSTVEGITAQYQKGVDALGRYTGQAADIIAEFTNLDGEVEQITWGSLFDDKGNTIDTQIAKVFHGADETPRNEFASIAKAVNEGKVSVDNAMKSFSISGVQAGYKLLENAVVEINSDIFKDLGDELSGLIDTFDEFGSALESVANSIELVNQAQAEMAYSGHVSVETALNLINSTEDWNKVLRIENGNITLVDGAMGILAQSKLNQIKTNLQLALSEAQAGLEQARLAESSGEVAKTLEESTTESVRQLAANMEYLSTLVGEFLNGNFLGAGSAAKAAKESSLKSTEYQKTSTTSSMSVADWEEKVSNIEAKLGILEGVDTPGEFENNYYSDKVSGGNDSPKDVVDDAFQKEMDYWENRIAANQAKYEQLQNEIDLLEAKGQKADASFYEEQMKLEGQRLELLNGQKAAAEAYLATVKEGSEEWWEAAKILNDLESEIDDVTASIVDLQDAIGEIANYKFEEFNTRLDNLVSKLSTIRDLIAPDGEENWFDDEGNWTEEGIAVVGSYIQELEFYKQGLEEVKDTLTEFENIGNGAEWSELSQAQRDAYANQFGIHSEQEYYEKTEELISQQYDFAESISDTEQSIVDMYESSIDATEEYIDTLIDGYSDYIDSVKEALDAERDYTL